MKIYQSTNTQSEQAKKVQEMIGEEIAKLENFGNFGPNPDSFLEKYCDPFFDSFRENEKDFELTNNELQKNFQIAYAYLQFLRNWVAIEEDYQNEVF